MNRYVVNAVATYFFFFIFFIIIGLNIGLMEGVNLVLEWEIREKLIGEIGLPIVVDWVSCLFLARVFYISICVNSFRGFYIRHETFIGRFSHLLQIFVFFIGVLVIFPGYLGLMVGWDGLGVRSFLLVIYYTNSESLSAGMITAIRNRVGDVCFILGIGVFSCYLRYSYIGGSLFRVPALGRLLFIGRITKRAQAPFSAWLPEAMAAPTPVSTLVHSSTLVTAGVYVLIRFRDYLRELDKEVLIVVSLITIIMAGRSGSIETDIKKVVALSTLRQVGMIMFCLGVGCNSVAFFHLVVHAYFKALMFICVGGVIFYRGGNQDARLLGGVWAKLPLTRSLLVFRNISLIGFPFFSGFYSKELIVGRYLDGSRGVVTATLLLVSLGLTVTYSVRILSLVLQDRGPSSLSHYRMENIFYLLPLMVMRGGAVISRVVMQSYFGGFLVVSFIRGSFFYRILRWIVLLFLNLLIVLLLLIRPMIIKFFKAFSRFIWFLKPLRGNVLRRKFLVKVSNFVGIVEMGWIRSFIWQNGLKEIIFGGRNKVRRINLNILGFIMFYSFCFIILVFF